MIRIFLLIQFGLVYLCKQNGVHMPDLVFPQILGVIIGLYFSSFELIKERRPANEFVAGLIHYFADLILMLLV